MNTKDTATYNERVNAFLARQLKANLIDANTGKLIKTVPLVRMMSDYRYQQLCLESRLKHREAYSEFEDVDEAIERLQAWLDTHEPEPEEEQPTEPQNIYINGFRAIKSAI